MKNILFFVFTLILSSSYGQTKPLKDTSELTWYGKKISKKDLEDSMRLRFIKYCDCVTIKPKKKKK